MISEGDEILMNDTHPEHASENFGDTQHGTNDEFFDAQEYSDLAIGQSPSDTTGGEPYFYDASTNSDEHGLYYFDPSDATLEANFIGHAFHLSIDYDKVIDSVEVDKYLMQLDDAELRGEHEEFDTFAYASRVSIQEQAHRYVDYLGYRPVNVIRKTLENTTQLATTILTFPMRRHVKSCFPHLNRN
jgi:hypothetical protein